MVYNLIITDEGESCIDNQLQYILFKLENMQAAKHFTDSIEIIYDNIEKNPYSYAECKDRILAMMGYHEAVFADMNYKLIYRIEENDIYVMGVYNDRENYVRKLR